MFKNLKQIISIINKKIIKKTINKTSLTSKKNKTIKTFMTFFQKKIFKIINK